MERNLGEILDESTKQNKLVTPIIINNENPDEMPKLIRPTPIKIDKKDKYKFSLVNSPNKQIITNIKYVISNDCFLYFTTKNAIYYKKLGETKLNIIGDEQIHSGTNPQNFDINIKRDVIISTPDTNLIEFYTFNNGNYERLYKKNI